MAKTGKGSAKRPRRISKTFWWFDVGLSVISFAAMIYAMVRVFSGGPYNTDFFITIVAGVLIVIFRVMWHVKLYRRIGTDKRTSA